MHITYNVLKRLPISTLVRNERERDFVNFINKTFLKRFLRFATL